MSEDSRTVPPRDAAPDRPATNRPPRGRAHRFRLALTFARRHALMAALLGAAALLRAGVMIAHYPAFGYFVDTNAYMTSAKTWTPNQIWPFGYPLLIAVLSPSGHTAAITLVQHLFGLAMGLIVYALLLRRGVSRWWAALAAAPVLLDSRAIVVEHYVLSDTLFVLLAVVALALLLWSDRLPVWASLLAGVVFACAAMTRTIGQVLPILAVLYLIARRVGWRQILAFVAAVVIPLGGYAVWFHHQYGVFGINNYSGRYLWSRTTSFVDCPQLNLTPAERDICPSQPVADRLAPDSYLWGDDPGNLVHRSEDDKVYRSLALKVIAAQPGAYASAVLVDALHLVQPGWTGQWRTECVHDLWDMPSVLVSDHEASIGRANCLPTLLARNYRPVGVGPAGANPDLLTRALSGYRHVTLPPLADLVLVVFALGAACWRARRLRPRDALDTVFLSTVAVALVMVSLAISAIDVRYALPLLPIVPPAAAIAATRLRTGAPARREAGRDRVSAPADPPEEPLSQ